MSPSPKSALLACTVVAKNYLPLARVLGATFEEHHPGNRLRVFVIDDPRGEAAREDGLDHLTLDDIGISPDEYLRMVGIYDVTELATAVKPWVLRALVRQGAPTAVYLDPDIAVFSPFEELPGLAAEHGIVLTPHVPTPLPDDGLYPEEESFLAAGVYNLGFIAVPAGAGDFLDWWANYLRRECVNDVTRMHFVDQRWIDFVPGIFPHVILRHPGYNVAYWNLHGRRVSVAAGGEFLVNGEPLRFFHFSGYSPDRPYLVSKHQGDQPRILLSERPDLLPLTEQYRTWLLENGWHARTERYGYAEIAGLEIDVIMRRLYRDALLAWERGETTQPPPPSPFDPDAGDAFLEWLNEPVHPLFQPRVSRYLYEFWSTSPSFLALAPVLVGEGAHRFTEWLRVHGPTLTALPLQVLPTSVPEVVAEVDESCRLRVVEFTPDADGTDTAMLLPGLEASSLTVAEASFSCTDDPVSPVRVPAARTSLLVSHPSMTVDLAFNAELGFLADTRMVAFWWWSQATFPPRLADAFHLLDEVWVPSTFSQRAVAALSPVPVEVATVAAVPFVSAVQRAELDLPADRPLFACVVDLREDPLCANTVDVIRSFAAAFAPDEGPLLAVFARHADRGRVAAEELVHEARDRDDIRVLVGSEVDKAGPDVTAIADCVVSLHRSTALGDVLLRSMATGIPVIATAFGGNLDYMHDGNSLLVPFLFGRAPAGKWAIDARWALPDVASAARAMRSIVADPAAAAARAARAQEEVCSRYSVAASAAWFESQVAAVESAAMRRDVSWFEGALKVTKRTTR